MPQVVVFDTNILLSALLSLRGNPFRCLALAKAAVVQSVTCQEILDEFVTTPTSTLVGFSVHPPAHRPVSPKAVPRPVTSGVTWNNARLGYCNRRCASPMTMNFLPGSGFSAGTPKAQL